MLREFPLDTRLGCGADWGLPHERYAANSRGHWLEVSADPPQLLALDGELLGTSPVRFEVNPRSLTVLTGSASVV
jgi:diacylglycerol kinase family enzyme